MNLHKDIADLESACKPWTRPAEERKEARQRSNEVALGVILELLAANESLRHELELERRRHGNC